MGAGTGAHHHRLALETRHTDLLPTSAAVAIAKAAADRIAAGLTGPAADFREPMRPTLELAVLGVACPEVAIERLALCLRLDPVEEPARLRSAQACSLWPADAVAAAVLLLGGEA